MHILTLIQSHLKAALHEIQSYPIALYELLSYRITHVFDTELLLGESHKSELTHDPWPSIFLSETTTSDLKGDLWYSWHAWEQTKRQIKRCQAVGICWIALNADSFWYKWRLGDVPTLSAFCCWRWRMAGKSFWERNILVTPPPKINFHNFASFCRRFLLWHVENPWLNMC